MKKHQTTAILMGVLFFSAACGNNHQAREEALEQRIARLEQERYVPGFGEFMNAIQLHHAKLWFAGQQGNWPLAAYETDEMEEVLANLKKNVKDRPEIRQLPMKRSTRLLVTAAALAGLYSGSLASRAFADDTAGTPAAKDDQKDKSSCKGTESCKAKDSCKGKESCKAKDAKDSKDKNSCNGKDGCSSKHA